MQKTAKMEPCKTVRSPFAYGASAALLALALAMTPAGARQGAGYAAFSVSDGDSFRRGGERYRLQDIDAPELHQTCKDAGGREWACGKRAREELRKLLGPRGVTCTPVTRDRFGRVVATCAVDGRDVGEAMVRGGWATAYRGRGLSGRYASAESEARAQRRGIWAGSFEEPRHWRDGHPRAAESGETVLSPAAQDWVRRKAQSVSDWFTSLWRRP
jgi:endonuclease YncB( thermonuclease family)